MFGFGFGFSQGVTMVWNPWLSWNSFCRLAWPWIHRDTSASLSRVLGLKVYTFKPTLKRSFRSLWDGSVGLHKPYTQVPSLKLLGRGKSTLKSCPSTSACVNSHMIYSLNNNKQNLRLKKENKNYRSFLLFHPIWSFKFVCDKHVHLIMWCSVV